MTTSLLKQRVVTPIVILAQCEVTSLLHYYSPAHRKPQRKQDKYSCDIDETVFKGRRQSTPEELNFVEETASGVSGL